MRAIEAERLNTRADKWHKRKAKEAPDTNVQQNPASIDFVWQTCGRACKSRIGLYSHSRATLTSSKLMTSLLLARASKLPGLGGIGTPKNFSRRGGTPQNL